MQPECPKIGHEKTRDALAAELPSQPVLLLGPESIGKWMLATWLAGVHAAWFNQWVEANPRIDRVRELRHFLATPPRPSEHGGELKVVAINMDGVKGGNAVPNALLKELEEPPPYARYLLVASRSQLATISSRCVIWRMGELTDQQVAEVLRRRGVPDRDAEMMAPAGKGRVAPALAAVERFRPARAAVTGVLKAIASRDRDLLERVAREWGDAEDWLLRELLAAAASGRPTPLFTSAERMLIGRTSARKGIALLAASGSARSQISVRAFANALMEREALGGQSS